MSRRAVVFVSSLAFVAMAAALVWMFHELSSAPVMPAAVKLAETAKRARSGPQRLAEMNASVPDTTAQTAATVDPAAAIEEALAHPDALPGEALLTFKTPEALAAFQKRAAQNGLEVVSIDPALLTARVRYKDVAG
ncbi:MAG: hypothetical protein JNG86_06080, partial [Verrucomicrobiaceae bacterium]|nr:hypothetical protein [Verrucomicrobiaceae bacterium]